MDALRKKDLEREIAMLQGHKGVRFRRVQRIYDLIGKLNDPAVRNQFHVLCENLEKTVSEFRNVVDRLNDLNLQLDEGFTVDHEDLDSLEDMVCLIRCAALESDSVPPKKSVPIALLPEIKIPTFSGDPLSWPLFYNVFRSLIHNNEGLNDITKMHYLRSSLKGRALVVCSGIPPTAASYPIVWENLVRKYQNPRLLADHYFRKMFDFHPLSSDSPEGLSNLADCFLNSHQALRQLDLTDLANFYITSLALSKLDPSTRKQFEMSHHSEIPTLDEVIQFIHRQAEALARSKPANPSKKSQSYPTYFPNSPQRTSHALVTESTPASTPGRPCPLCREPHTVYLCNTFLKASSDDRWQLVEKNRLCFNCLSDVHILSSCKSQRSCRHCRKRHHTLLHRDSITKKPKDPSTLSHSLPLLKPDTL